MPTNGNNLFGKVLGNIFVNPFALGTSYIINFVLDYEERFFS